MSDPINGVIEIAGPAAIGVPNLIRDVLNADHDPRTVVGDPHARYFGTERTDTSLTPGPDARLGPTTFTIGSPSTTGKAAITRADGWSRSTDLRALIGRTGDNCAWPTTKEPKMKRETNLRSEPSREEYGFMTAASPIVLEPATQQVADAFSEPPFL